MKNLDDREWLLTNGLGSFASGTVTDARTRTYHGWLVAALDPPSQRTLLLSHIEASLEVAGKVIALGTNYWGNNVIEPKGFQLLHHFKPEPLPTWMWQEDHWQLTRQIIMPHVGATPSESDTNRVLIQYCYKGKVPGILRLRFMIADRDFHHQQQADPNLQFSQLLGQQQVFLQALRPGWVGTPWRLRWTAGKYQHDPVWYWNYRLPEETNRGLSDREDLYSPGYLTIHLDPGSCITLEARVGFPNRTLPTLQDTDFADAIQLEQQRLAQTFNFESSTSSYLQQQLLRASDQFVVYRASIAGPTVIAGYHWFNDWGRDTLIALPGLALTTRRFDLAKGLLQTFGRYCRHGLIPNTFPDTSAEPSYNSIDAALLWIETLGLYLEATQDWDFLVEEYAVVQQIYKAFMAGTKFNIQVDAADGLVSWDAPSVALTWMDAIVRGQPVTPRRGKPVEINALWYSALCWASTWAQRLSQEDGFEQTRLLNQARRYQQQAEQVKDSMQKFWNPTNSYLYDTIEPDDRRNPQIRPNAVLALSFHHSAFPALQGRQILEVARAKLLTPYGLRSLAPEDVQYVGKCTGDVQQRDRAYHQGTVWSWLIGSFIRAWQRYTSQPVPFDWQPLLEHFHAQACIGSISEIFDGDAPHTPRGAIAQAWSVAEVIRHINSTAMSS
ncbi:glycogen debranching enzyme [Gloeocapsa sp. PCC 7428]|uniref:amylo-alpha-1,6-glucosidase n=1 Tax=Gloeocapsa sp. PCC 7428 TaxID=1173026 RepID=UPI0002A5EBAC|nr:amylo-alpha-1,6-glucosidase [Gloeocapsa sp. PCC 7428]AFZ31174.1 glycogen debranching enzyme [Gloeocapsa sp. PCC 7428]